MNTAVSLARNGRADRVDNTNCQSTTLKAVLQSQNGVGSLTGLGNKNTSVVSKHGRPSVQKVRGQLDRHRNLSEFFKNGSGSKARVVRGTTGNHDNAAAAANRREPRAQATQLDSVIVKVNATTHSVNDRFGLLENLLLHKVGELALHNLLELHLKGLNGTSGGLVNVTADSVNVKLAIRNMRNIVVLKEQNLSSVFNHSGGVGGHEKLNGSRGIIIREESTRLRVSQGLRDSTARNSEQVASTARQKRASVGLSVGLNKLNVNKVNLEFLLSLDTNEQGGTLAGSNKLVRVVNRLDNEAIGTLKLLDNLLGQIRKVGLVINAVLLNVLVVDELGELGNSLSVGFRLKSVALGLEERLDFTVVGNDTIVDNDKLIVQVRALGVAVDGLGLAVSSPSSVGNTGVALKDLVLINVLRVNVLLEQMDLTNLVEDLDISRGVEFAHVGEALVAINAKTSRVIATVLLALKTLNEGAYDVTSCLGNKVVDITKNATVEKLVIEEKTEKRVSTYHIVS